MVHRDLQVNEGLRHLNLPSDCHNAKTWFYVILTELGQKLPRDAPANTRGPMLHLLAIPVLARLVFDTVSTIGDFYGSPPKPPARHDPHSTIAFGQAVLANANGSTWASKDGGASWERQPWQGVALAQVVPTAPHSRTSFDSGMGAYYQNASTSFGTDRSCTWTYDQGTFNRTCAEGAGITFTGLPFKTYELAWSAGGVATLSDGTFVASATLWGEPAAPPYPQPAPGRAPGPCCNNSLGIFKSTDGVGWNFASVIAHKA